MTSPLYNQGDYDTRVTIKQVVMALIL